MSSAQTLSIEDVESNFTPYQCLLLNHLRIAFSQSVDHWVNPDTDIVTTEFESIFRTRLLYHHVVTDEPLNKTSFEYALRDASRITGKKATLNPSSTASSYDVNVDDVRFSLKTEGSKGMSKNSIHISKLRECAWLKGCSHDREKLVKEIHKYVLPLFDGYDRALDLRIFRGKGLRIIEYQMVEIPKGMFLAIGDLTPEDFEEMRDNNSTSATVKYNNIPAYTMRFDGSDDKITLTSIPVNLCITHATWKIPVIYTTQGSDYNFQMQLGI